MSSAATKLPEFEGPSTFPSTSWSTLLKAANENQKRKQLDRLFRKYYKAIYTFIKIKCRPTHAEDALDLTQSFCMSLIESDFLKDLSPEKGKFRSYLKACLRHHVADERKLSRAKKRGGDTLTFSIESFDPPLEIASLPADKAFDRQWLYSLLEASVKSLENFLIGTDRSIAFRLFERVDVNRSFSGRPNYEELALAFEISKRQVKSELEYARRTFRKIVHSEIKSYTLSHEEIQEEFEELFNTDSL